MPKPTPASRAINGAASDTPDQIDRLFAVVHVRPSGGEGIIAILDPATGVWHPMVTPIRTTALAYFDKTRAMPEHKGSHLRLLQFTKRAVMQEHGTKQVKC